MNLSGKPVPLKLSLDHIHAMQIHAERMYPDECCGLLLGAVQLETRHLQEVRAVENAWDAEVAAQLEAEPSLTKTRRYWISADQMLATMRHARHRNLDIVGIYHSHPDQPAVPSECDRRLAWQQYSYIILSVAQGKAGKPYSWYLDQTHQFQPEEILVEAPA